RELPMRKRSANSLHHAATCALLTILTQPLFAAPPNVKVSDLGTLGGRFTVVADINATGEVTGYSETSDEQIHAFVYSNNEMHDLGTLGGTGSLGNAINDAGQVTGFSLTAAGESHAFLYTAGAMADLGASGTASSGKAINRTGEVAGEATPSGGD